MARKARKNSIDPSIVQVMHVWNRCVRAMMLCGVDAVTGVDREYRREWSRARLEHLAKIFAIEVLTYSVMSNHTHQVLRSRPDLARQWSPEMVARRWLMITPKMDRFGKIIEPSAKRIKAITDNTQLVEKLRLRLSDVSWWMRSYAQNIATRANREDNKQGHFWEDRFKVHLLVDEASILRCMLYIDLNPIRAAMADSIEQSDYTGAKDRLDDLRIHVATNSDNQITLTFESGPDIANWERLEHPCSGWLSPIQIDAHQSEAVRDPDGSTPPESTTLPRRISRRGATRISLTKYLLLLDLVGRQQRAGGSGFVPAEVVPILEQLNMEPTGFIESILLFGKRFKSSRFSRPKVQVDSGREIASPVFAL